jgi:hypothetical protein
MLPQRMLPLLLLAGTTLLPGFADARCTMTTAL